MSETRKKTLELKDAIYQLYSIEGRSLNYISKLFNLSRITMTDVIKNDLGFTQEKVRQPTTKTEKLINKHKQDILLYCANWENRELPALLERLGLSRSNLRCMREYDKDIDTAVSTFTNKPTIKQMAEKRRLEKEALWSLDLEDLKGEVWKEVVGYEGLYWVSNLARVKSNVKILTPDFNDKIGRYQIHLHKNGKRKSYKRYRLVAGMFIPNFENKPTVNHKNGDTTDDVLSNLEWSSYSEQNYHRNKVLKRPIAVAHGKNGRFTQVVIDNKYTFKTLVAAAKFLGVSETQIQRYLSGETPFNRKIELKY